MVRSSNAQLVNGCESQSSEKSSPAGVASLGREIAELQQFAQELASFCEMPQLTYIAAAADGASLVQIEDRVSCWEREALEDVLLKFFDL